MASLRYVGVDPETPNSGSPTVWIDEEDDSIIIQGWKIDDQESMSQILATGPIPEHETVLRLPRRMEHILREALQ